MNKKRLWLLFFSTVILVSFISGCVGSGGQFGAPSRETATIGSIKGIVVAPNGDCFNDICVNPLITDGNPLPNADIILKSENHTLTGKTDCSGNYQISGLIDDGYVLYANHGDVWIKKAISPVTGDGGEANYFTTAQVILWEVVENSFPGSIPIKEIPTAIPIENLPQDLLDAVKAALADCRDAQKDKTVISLAKNFAYANFGAPCAPCVEPNFVTAVRIPDNPPTPTPEPTPDPTPTPKPDTITIPTSAQMTLLQHSYNQSDPYWNMTFDVALPPSTPGGSGQPGTEFDGWCIEENQYISAGVHQVKLYSYDNVPSDYKPTAQWDKVNWILNNSSGYSQDEIAQAIWNFTGNSSYSNSLVEAADQNGTGFVPESGQLMAVVVVPENQGNDDGLWTDQDLITVVDP